MFDGQNWLLTQLTCVVSENVTAQLRAINLNLCCLCNKPACVVDLTSIQCLLETLICNQSTVQLTLSLLELSLLTVYPLVALGEFPEILVDKVVYHYNGLFRNVVNKLAVIFRGTLDSLLPVYLLDNSGFNHIVTALDSTDLLLGNLVISNQLFNAIYDGNYIRLVSLSAPVLKKTKLTATV